VHNEKDKWSVKSKGSDMNLMNINAHRDIRKWRNEQSDQDSDLDQRFTHWERIDYRDLTFNCYLQNKTSSVSSKRMSQ